MKLAVLPGDGIGPEIVHSAVVVAKAALSVHSVPANDWPILPFGLSAIESHDSAVPEETLEALGKTDG